MKKPFYQKAWFIVISLIFFAPLGIFLLWKYSQSNRFSKVVISAFFGAVFLFNLFSAPKQLERNVSTSGNSLSVSQPSPNTYSTSSSQIASEISTSSNYEASSKLVDDASTSQPSSSVYNEPSNSDVQESTQAPVKPPNTYNEASEPVAQKSTQEPVKPPVVNLTYVLNTSTMKIHHASCRDVKKIKAENYAETNDYEQAIAQGYVPCKHCNP